MLKSFSLGGWCFDGSGKNGFKRFHYGVELGWVYRKGSKQGVCLKTWLKVVSRENCLRFLCKDCG